MLLDDLLETGIVELRVFGEIVDIGYNIAEISFEQLEILLETFVCIGIRGSVQFFLPVHNLLYFLLT